MKNLALALFAAIAVAGVPAHAREIISLHIGQAGVYAGKLGADGTALFATVREEESRAGAKSSGATTALSIEQSGAEPFVLDSLGETRRGSATVTFATPPKDQKSSFSLVLVTTDGLKTACNGVLAFDGTPAATSCAGASGLTVSALGAFSTKDANTFQLGFTVAGPVSSGTMLFDDTAGKEKVLLTPVTFGSPASIFGAALAFEGDPAGAGVELTLVARTSEGRLVERTSHLSGVESDFDGNLAFARVAAGDLPARNKIIARRRRSN